MFTLEQVVPWGRSFDEYRRMFALTETDLDRRMLGCGDGPASFNAEATRRGHRVVSCDPIYGFGRSQIQERIAATYDQVLAQTRLNAHEFVWREGIRDVEGAGTGSDGRDAGPYRAAGSFDPSRFAKKPNAIAARELSVA